MTLRLMAESPTTPRRGLPPCRPSAFRLRFSAAPLNRKRRVSTFYRYATVATLAFVVLATAAEVHAQDDDAAATQPADAPAMMNGEAVIDPDTATDADADNSTDTDTEADADDPRPDKPRTVSVSFRNAEMSQVARFLMDELGKPVIVDERIGETRITIMSDDAMPLPAAFELIGNALRQKGVLVVESARQTELLPLDQMRRINRPVVGDDESAADLADQSQIVDKEFAVEHYDVTRLKDLVLAMLPEYAFLVADPNLNRLVVTAAAADLAHIERLVAELDVPRANQTVERIIEVENGDASEIVALVRTLISATLGIESQDVFTSPRANTQSNNRGNNNRNNRGGNTRRTRRPWTRTPAASGCARLGCRSPR